MLRLNGSAHRPGKVSGASLDGLSRCATAHRVAPAVAVAALLAQIVPSTAAATRSADANAAASTAAYTLPQTAIAHDASVAVRVECPSAAQHSCAITLTLRSAEAVAVGSHKEILTIGQGSVTLGSGHTGSVHIKLGAEARHAVVSHHDKLAVKASVASREGRGHSADTSRQITLELSEQSSPLY